MLSDSYTFQLNEPQTMLLEGFFWSNENGPSTFVQVMFIDRLCTVDLCYGAFILSI